ncbi:MAG: flavodoxin family protein [Actinomycetota bacterium]
MKALVVFESLYGNTGAVGEAIAEGMRTSGMPVKGGSICNIPPEAAEGMDLLVVGGPTHVHGMTWARTRRIAIDDLRARFEVPVGDVGLREWMHGLPRGGLGRRAVAFDTRYDKSLAVSGSAALGIARRLEGHGYVVVTPPQSFFVTEENQLEPGQLERAEEWGADIALSIGREILGSSVA